MGKPWSDPPSTNWHVAPLDEVNIAEARDAGRQEARKTEIQYNYVTDEGLASRRSKHVVRNHAEVAAATKGELPSGLGLSLRAPMAGQCENDQWPYCTDNYGKQRN